MDVRKATAYIPTVLHQGLLSEKNRRLLSEHDILYKRATIGPSAKRHSDGPMVTRNCVLSVCCY